MFAQVGWFFLHLYCWFINAQERDALLSLTADRKVPQCLQLAEPLTCCLEHRQSFDKGAAAACLGSEIHGVGGNTMVRRDQEHDGFMRINEKYENNIWSDLCTHVVCEDDAFSCIMYCCRLVWWAEPSHVPTSPHHPAHHISPGQVSNINWSRLFSFGPEWLLVIITFALNKPAARSGWSPVARPRS